MIIYLAARYSRHEYMQAVRTSLQMKGHTVTSRWIEAPEGKYGRGGTTRGRTCLRVPRSTVR